MFNRNTNLNRLRCPFCGNNNILVYVDFEGGRESRKHLAKCVVKAYKPSIIRKFHKTYIRGCGREFYIIIPQKVEKI